MYMISFIYQPGQYDNDFDVLNNAIDEIALQSPGYVGQESWRSKDGTRNNATYYWDSLEHLKTFSRHPKHIEAKRQYQRWYAGFQIVIAEVVRSYGDGRLAHITPNERHPDAPRGDA